MDLNALIAQMTIEEKVGQLMLLPSAYFGTEGELTGPAQEWGLSQEELACVGSCIGGKDINTIKKIQLSHLSQDRNKIPLIFMNDIIHGYRTIYPINLGLSCSFDPALVGECTEMAAREAAAGGVHLTFAPMVDLSRDARWGRVMESAGEDTLLSCVLGAAAVRAFQGEDISSPDRLAACVKHFAAYGAGESGRDYSTVELSERTLRQFYLPSYKACVDAGVKALMPSFNDVCGLPSTANPFLMKQILAKEWGFDGLVISDYAAVYELTVHGIAEDLREAAVLAFDSGCTVEMCSKAYYENLASLVRDGVIPEGELDRAVMKVLKLKDELGLFDDPFHGASAEAGDAMYLSPTHREIARRASVESAVLLKNDGTLPFSRKHKRIAVVGPFAEDNFILGCWSSKGRPQDAVSVADGIRAMLPDAEIVCARGCSNRTADEDADLGEAVRVAKDADAVVICVGEHAHLSGEANCRTSLTLPGLQAELVRSVISANPNSAVLLFGGRPLDLSNIYEASPAILNMFFPGVEGGNAAAALLFGTDNPSGKLSMSFPKSVGQCPIYYNRRRTGRPKTQKPDEAYEPFTNGYVDCGSLPLFFFGEGLSYTEFEYEKMELDRHTIDKNSTLKVSVTLKNKGSLRGKEVVQLYICDKVSSAVRPVQELIAFKKISLEAGERTSVCFEINEEMLRFFDANARLISEPGDFDIFVGYADHPYISDTFTLV